jgi:hypothetical protein
MADFLRSQNLARVQGQQQQQFGLSSPQMNAPGQHPSFNDQQGSQQSQSQVPVGFGSTIGIANPTQLQANFNNRNAMLQAFNQGPMSRQLELMGLAQNQQHPNPQVNSANYAARMAQQQQQGGMNSQNQQGQPTLFSSPAMQTSDTSRSSPPHSSSQTSMPNQQVNIQTNGQGIPPGRRPMTLVELRDRASQIQAFIAKQEAAAMNLSHNRASLEQAAFVAQMQALVNDVRSKKELLSKVLQAMNQLAPQGSINSSGNGPPGVNPGTM